VAEKNTTKRLTASQRLAAQQRAQRKAQAEAIKAKRARQKAQDKARLSAIKERDRARLKAEKERLKRLARSRREHDRQAAKRLKERQKAAKEALKEAQHLLARARKALSKSQRKKQKTPVRYLSPKSIAKKAQELKEKGAKLAPEKPKTQIGPTNKKRITVPYPELRPPKKGYITQRCFRPQDDDEMLDFVNSIYDVYIETGGFGKSPIYRFMVKYFYEDGRIQSTLLYVPYFATLEDLEDMYYRAKYDEKSDAPDSDIEKICVVISWSRDFLKTQNGWAAK